MVDRNHSRRAVLSGLTAAGVVAATAATATPAAVTPADEADRLYGEIVALVPEMHALSKAWNEAHERIPGWAKPGPKYILRSAEEEPHYFGKQVHWPLDANVEIWGTHAICRPSPNDLKLEYKSEMGEVARALSGRSEAEVRARYRKRLRAFIERKRAAEAEYGRECDVIDALNEINADKRCDAEASIRELAPTPNSVAALVLLAAIVQKIDAYADVIDLEVLRHVRHHTTGLIRDHLDEWFKMLEDEPYAKLIAMPPFYDFG